MNHLDEGTIHAWLDGVLNAERSHDVETHVASCAQCSAAVAEARGLIAGASRILTALDDVPANVTPKRMPSLPSAPARRQWRAAPWVTGIAAALVLAIGVTTWNRDGSRMASSESALAGVTKRDSAVTETAQSFADPAAPSPQPGAGAGPSVTTPPAANAAVAQRRDGAKLEQKSVPPPVADVAAGRAAGGAAQPRDFSGAADASEARRRLRSEESTGVARAGADTTRLRTLSAPAAMQLSEVVVTAAPSAVDSVAATIAVSGCYRLASAAEERESDAKSLTKRAAEAAAGAAAAASSRAKARPAAPAAPLRDRSGFVGQRPAIVRLDARAGAESRAHDPGSSSYLGTWQRVGDSVRVNLFLHGTFTLAAKDSVRCP